MKKTKIICTIGPACSDIETLKKMIKSGMNVARFNMSHGSHVQHHKLIELVKKARKELNVPVAIMIDTRGPEIRIKEFENGSIELKKKDNFTLTTRKIMGNKNEVSVTYSDFSKIINKGSRIFLNDGFLELEVISKTETDVLTKVISGGVLSNNKSINLPKIDYKMQYLSDQDKKDIEFGFKEGCDLISLSFISKKQDIIDVRKFMKSLNGEDVILVAKIESKFGVDNMDEIISVADGVMVARGDLGVEVEFEKIPFIQKSIIKKCDLEGKLVITATQMLESMISNSRPTRAEISDVANAIVDGTSCIMLSGETSVGAFPVIAVKTMAKIAKECEEHMTCASFQDDYELVTDNISASIGYAGCTLAESLKAKAIIAPTSTGWIAKCVSRFRPNCAIIASTPNEKVYNQLAAYYGVYAVMDVEVNTTDELIASSKEIAKQSGIVKTNDLVVITAAQKVRTSGSNLLIVEKI